MIGHGFLPLNERIAANVKELMWRKRLRTQTELAKATGVKQPTLSNLFAGKLMVMPKTVKKLADFFGVSPDDLMYRELYDPTSTMNWKGTRIPLLDAKDVGRDL